MLLNHMKIIGIYLQFRSNDPLFGINPAFASRLRLRVMRDPVMRAMEGGGESRAGHVRQPSTRVVVMVPFPRLDETLMDLEKRDEMVADGCVMRWMPNEMECLERLGEGGARCQGFRGCVPRKNGKVITRAALTCLRQV